MLLFFVFFALFGSFWFFYAVFLQIRFVKIYAPFRIKSFWLACVKSCIFASLLIVCYIVYNFLNLHDKKYLNCYPWHSDCCPDIGNFLLASIQACCACWLHTLPDATPPIGKINLFHNITIFLTQNQVSCSIFCNPNLLSRNVPDILATLGDKDLLDTSVSLKHHQSWN